MTDKLELSRNPLKKYRAAHRRIDYAPSAVALTIINRHLESGLDSCIAGVLDQLIVAGDKAISGNT